MRTVNLNFCYEKTAGQRQKKFSVRAAKVSYLQVERSGAGEANCNLREPRAFEAQSDKDRFYDLETSRLARRVFGI